MYTPLFVIALHLSYKHAAWAVPGAGARPLIWKTVVHSLLTALCDAFGKVRGTGIYGWEEKHSPRSGCSGSCNWLQEEAALRKDGSINPAASPVLNTFCRGAGTGADGTKHFPLWDLAACSNADGSQIPALWGVRHHTAAPDPWGLATGAQKHQCMWIAPLQAILFQAIELLKMGAACFLGAGQGVPNSPRYDAAFFCQYGALKLREEQPFLRYFWPS